MSHRHVYLCDYVMSCRKELSMQIILIAGKAGVGKTVLADIIAKEAFKCGVVPVLLSFAGPLKEEAKEKGYSKEEYPEKYREYCQSVGAAMRELDKDHWVKLMHESLSKVLEEEKKHLESGDIYWERCVIVDDCRYINEIAYGVAKDAVRLFLSNGKRELPDFEWRDHESEAMANLIESGEGDEYLDLFHHVVYNDKTEKALEVRVRDMIPIWCGVKIGNDEDGLLCGCEGCRSSRENRDLDVKSLFTEMLDLMDLEEWDDEETKEDNS